jgi:phospholipase/lecithinase/hemolysin
MNSTSDEIKVTVDLSDFVFDLDEKDISSLESYSIPPLAMADTITLSGDSTTDVYTYGSGSYSYGNISAATLGGSSTSIYVGTNPATVTLSPSTYSNIPTWNNPYSNGNIQIQGDANVDGTLKVKGVDIGETLSKIQDQLAIYQPAPELEEKWEELRELARKYKELVADIKEKEKIWDILKK